MSKQPPQPPPGGEGPDFDAMIGRLLDDMNAGAKAEDPTTFGKVVVELGEVDKNTNPDGSALIKAQDGVNTQTTKAAQNLEGKPVTAEASTTPAAIPPDAKEIDASGFQSVLTEQVGPELDKQNEAARLWREGLEKFRGAGKLTKEGMVKFKQSSAVLLLDAEKRLYSAVYAYHKHALAACALAGIAVVLDPKSFVVNIIAAAFVGTLVHGGRSGKG